MVVSLLNKYACEEFFGGTVTRFIDSKLDNKYFMDKILGKLPEGIDVKINKKYKGFVFVDNKGKQIEGQRDISIYLKGEEMNKILKSEEVSNREKIVINSMKDAYTHMFMHAFPEEHIFTEDEPFCYSLKLFFGGQMLSNLKEMYGITECPRELCKRYNGRIIVDTRQMGNARVAGKNKYVRKDKLIDHERVGKCV